MYFLTLRVEYNVLIGEVFKCVIVEYAKGYIDVICVVNVRKIRK